MGGPVLDQEMRCELDSPWFTRCSAQVVPIALALSMADHSLVLHQGVCTVVALNGNGIALNHLRYSCVGTISNTNQRYQETRHCDLSWFLPAHPPPAHVALSTR